MSIDSHSNNGYLVLDITKDMDNDVAVIGEALVSLANKNHSSLSLTSLFVHLQFQPTHIESRDHKTSPFGTIMHVVSRLYGCALGLEPEIPFNVLLPRSPVPPNLVATFKLNTTTHCIELWRNEAKIDETAPLAWGHANNVGGAKLSDDDDDGHQQLEVYDFTCVGGTFDHLHSGHKVLLTGSALITNKKLTIGLSDGPLLANKQYKEWLEPFEQRKAHLEAFLHTLNPSLELYIARLVDVAGPAGTDVDLQAIVVSEETAKGADTINSGRQASGLSTLASWCIPVIEAPAALLAVRHDVKISSTTLRKRAADRAAAAAAAATTPQ